MFIFTIAIMGVGLAVASQAATYSIQIDPTSGTSGSAMIMDDPSASGGKYAMFGGGHSGTGCADGPAITSINFCINPASIPAAIHPSTSKLVRSASYSPVQRDVAAFRTDCAFSHASRDDPIVYPGQDNAAHWHVFAGNTSINENTTNPKNTGGSTCYGGIMNRTGYWVPALIDTNSYNSTTKQYDLVQPMRPEDTRSGESVGGEFLQVYYKSAYEGVLAKDIQWFPEGFKMIAGNDASNASTQNVGFNDGNKVIFDCISNGNAQSYWGTYGLDHRTDRVPTRCPAGYYIQGSVRFPQCGARNSDGSPVLDSANHRSHVSYGAGWPDLGCPSSHPIAYPEVLEHFRWRVPSTGASGLKFSSDMYPSAQPGWTFHADWWNGWDTEASNSIIQNCYKGSAIGLDCQMNLLGDGRELTIQ